MKLTGRKVLVVGLGKSGVSAIRLCLAQGARVIGNDSGPPERLSAEAQALKSQGVNIIASGHEQAPWDQAELVVVSPGVPPLPMFQRLADRGVPVIGELELASRYIERPTIAIGGTNGKSTTTSLVAAMLSKSGAQVFAGGNLGTPLSDAVGHPYDHYVIEVSSFQAERLPSYAPHIAVLLNITDDHLDRYESFQQYAAAKGNMFVHQSEEDVAIVPKGDAIVAREAARGDARIVSFGPQGDVRMEGDVIVDKLRERRYPIADIKLPGAHNLLNAMAAIACASEAGARYEDIGATLATFGPLPHRTVFVAEVSGVRFYDDSKGTNVGAATASVRGLTEERVVLIAGGRDKGGAYGPLVLAVIAKNGAFVLLGEASDKISAAIGSSVPTSRASSMREAVEIAHALAKPGDAVLLSPGCSSFDMFRDYAHRGESFAEEVLALSKGAILP